LETKYIPHSRYQIAEFEVISTKGCQTCPAICKIHCGRSRYRCATNNKQTDSGRSRRWERCL